ncbi:hypothetical protein F5884DRAFT_428381 [Xylogone sp. PMI_703]|nr:hypothetical protein F5884DRAFT_428381 [Xylogone sp. PMI_703]
MLGHSQITAFSVNVTMPARSAPFSLLPGTPSVHRHVPARAQGIRILSCCTDVFMYLTCSVRCQSRALKQAYFPVVKYLASLVLSCSRETHRNRHWGGVEERSINSRLLLHLFSHSFKSILSIRSTSFNILKRTLSYSAHYIYYKRLFGAQIQDPFQKLTRMPSSTPKTAIDRAAEMLEQKGYRFTLKTGGVTYSATLQHRDSYKKDQPTTALPKAELSKPENTTAH